MCRVEYKPNVVKSLKKLNKFTARLIVAWIEKNLLNTANPRLHGKCLSANLSGSWRYRVGDYRIIANINDKTKIILVLAIDHRSAIYKK